MFQGFLHPALALGAGLAAVPLIIHLLNRRRHTPVRWAAVRFVLEAYRKTRRRVELENLLLLLLRMAAVALLALAVSRPFTSSESPLASLTESRRDVLLVLDDSGSTGYRENGEPESVHDRIVARVRSRIEELDGGRGDRVQLVLAASQPRLLSWSTPENALAILPTIVEPSDEELDLVAALGEVLVLAEEDAAGTGESTLEVRLFTDLQRRSFDPGGAAAAPPHEDGDEVEGAPARPPLTEQLDALAELGVRVLVEDLGPEALRPPNLSVERVEPLTPIAGPGAPVDVAVTIANRGESPRPAVRVALEVDGERLPSQRVDLPAGGRAQAVFSMQFEHAGAHAVVALLEGDNLRADDARAAVLEVPEPISVLLVNGAQAPRIEDDELGLVLAVLEPPDDGGLPGSGGSAPFRPREVTPEMLLSADLELADHDVIVLANVTDSALTPGAIARLEERVAAGATLILTVGDRVAGDGRGGFGYNDKLFRADGSGLLPAELLAHVAVASREHGRYRVGAFDATHPALEFYADESWRPLLTAVSHYEFLATRPLPDARVLIELDDEARSPLLVERAYDQGRVLLWTTTIDNAWTRLPEFGRSLVPFVHELVRYAGRRRGAERNVAPGAPVRLEVASFPRSPQLVRPDGSRRPLDGEVEETAAGRWRLPLVPGAETREAGLYAIELEGGRREPFAVQFPPAEGELERLAPGELAGLHPALVAVERDGSGSGGDDGLPQRGELWRWLALGALLAVVGESLWGAWLGIKRRIA